MSSPVSDGVGVPKSLHMHAHSGSLPDEKCLTWKEVQSALNPLHRDIRSESFLSVSPKVKRSAKNSSSPSTETACYTLSAHSAMPILLVCISYL